MHVDEMSLEVLGINLTLNTNHWKKSRAPSRGLFMCR